MFGFLLGYPRLEPIWGRAAWSPIEGSALADDTDPELIRDLYAAWSQHFVGMGYFRQYVHAAVDEPDLMATWVRQASGRCRRTRFGTWSLEPIPAGVTVRRAHAEDSSMAADRFWLVGRALVKPRPTPSSCPKCGAWCGADPQELAEPEARHWVAIDDADGRAWRSASFYDPEPGPLVRSRSTELSLGMTRRRNAGVA